MCTKDTRLLNVIFSTKLTKKIIIFLVAAIVIVAVALGLYYGLQPTDGDDQADGQFRGAVVANGFECAKIGT